MLLNRCELFAPEYDEQGLVQEYISRGRVWAHIQPAHTQVENVNILRRNQSPPAKPLYKILLRCNHLCERGWRLRFRKQYFAILSEPIFFSPVYNQYFIQTLEHSEI